MSLMPFPHHQKPSVYLNMSPPMDLTDDDLDSLSSDEGFNPRSPTLVGSEDAEFFCPPRPPRLNPEVNADNMKIYTRDDLKKVSRFIRDKVIPSLKGEGDGMQTATLLAGLVDQLKMMREAIVDDDLLVNTRIERALLEIMDLKGEIPKNIIDTTSTVLDTWATQLKNPIGVIKPNLWGKGGIMEGLIRVSSWKKKSKEEKMTARLVTKNWEEVNSKWKLAKNFAANMEKSYDFGDRGLVPGKWWPKPMCATRDGIIDGSGNPFTFDDEGVYALILSDHVEELHEEGRPPGSVVKYTMIAPNPAKFRLLRNNLRREPVRILRHHRLGTEVAPRFGLRFDGMYNIDQIGTKLTSRTGVDLWRIEVTFNRARGQPPLGTAQVHPMSDEREDWEEYQRNKIEMRNAELAAEALRDAEAGVGRLVREW